jgi:hypothetical protein
MPMPEEVNTTVVPQKEQTENNQNENRAITCSFSQCTDEHVTECRKCKRPFCVIHANRFTPNFCQECFKHLSAVEEKFSRVFDDYDTKTNTVTIKKTTNTRYYMDGIDWPFLGVWIRNLSEDELRIWWIFHFSVMKLIETENESRRVEKYRKLRDQSVGLISKTQTTSKGTTKITKPVDTADDVRKKLRKQGIPENIIEMMVKTMGV